MLAGVGVPKRPSGATPGCDHRARQRIDEVQLDESLRHGHFRKPPMRPRWCAWPQRHDVAAVHVRNAAWPSSIACMLIIWPSSQFPCSASIVPMSMVTVAAAFGTRSS